MVREKARLQTEICSPVFFPGHHSGFIIGLKQNVLERSILRRWDEGLKSATGDITSVAKEKGGMSLMTGLGRGHG